MVHYKSQFPSSWGVMKWHYGNGQCYRKADPQPGELVRRRREGALQTITDTWLCRDCQGDMQAGGRTGLGKLKWGLEQAPTMKGAFKRRAGTKLAANFGLDHIQRCIYKRTSYSCLSYFLRFAAETVRAKTAKTSLDNKPRFEISQVINWGWRYEC